MKNHVTGFDRIISIIQTAGIVLLLAVGLFTIRFLVPESIENNYLVGADGWFISENLVEQNPFPLYYRSLLTVLIHKGVYLLLQPFGVSGWYAVSFSSSLAGGIAIVALWNLRRHWMFIAINVLSGSFIVMIGHVENYSWVNAFLILSYWGIQRWLENKSPLWIAMLFFILACVSHMLALFYVPAFIYIVWTRRSFHPYEILVPLLMVLIPFLALNLCFQMLGTDIGLERLVPWFSRWAKNHHFTFASKEHLLILAYFHWRASWLGIPLELPALLWLRKRIQTPFEKFMLVNVVCGVVWTTLWHPDWGRLDWDLFSQFGVPTHILIGYLVTQPWPACKENESS